MIMKKTAFLLALASTDVSARSLRKGTVIDKNDITEDIEFWTRMTQAMGSMVSFKKLSSHVVLLVVDSSALIHCLLSFEPITQK